MQASKFYWALRRHTVLSADVERTLERQADIWGLPSSVPEVSEQQAREDWQGLQTYVKSIRPEHMDRHYSLNEACCGLSSV